MKSIKATVAVIAACAALSTGAKASVTTVRFTNADVDLGTSSAIDLTTEYSALGLQFTDVYRYIDGRDPFSDAPNQELGANLGISNGRLDQNFLAATTGRVDFSDGNTPFATVDWWTIAGTFTVDAYNSADVLQDSFSGSGSGTETLTGDIAYLKFHDSGGFVQIANLSFDRAAVPESTNAFALLSVSCAGLVLAARARKN